MPVDQQHRLTEVLLLIQHEAKNPYQAGFTQ